MSFQNHVDTLKNKCRTEVFAHEKICPNDFPTEQFTANPCIALHLTNIGDVVICEMLFPKLEKCLLKV